MPNDDDEFKNDPEAGGNAKKYRLPFALCKAKNIKIQDWWTPRDAWNALKRGGVVEDVDDEYADYYRKRKKERAKEYRKTHPWAVQASRLRSETKKRQLASLEHNPDKAYTHKDGMISGSAKAQPMTFEQADSGHCNPYYDKKDEKSGVNFIGYHTNCQTCVATYFARRLGYDVRALPNLNNREIDDLSFNTSLAYLTKEGKHPEQIERPYGEWDTAGWIASTIKPNEIYSVQFGWRGRRSGHIITAEKLGDGILRLYDPQTDTVMQDIAEVKSYFNRTKGAKIMNLTNCTLDEKFCDKIMKKAGK